MAESGLADVVGETTSSTSHTEVDHPRELEEKETSITGLGNSPASTSHGSPVNVGDQCLFDVSSSRVICDFEEVLTSHTVVECP